MCACCILGSTTFARPPCSLATQRGSLPENTDLVLTSQSSVGLLYPSEWWVWLIVIWISLCVFLSNLCSDVLVVISVIIFKKLFCLHLPALSRIFPTGEYKRDNDILHCLFKKLSPSNFISLLQYHKLLQVFTFSHRQCSEKMHKLASWVWLGIVIRNIMMVKSPVYIYVMRSPC